MKDLLKKIYKKKGDSKNKNTGEKKGSDVEAKEIDGSADRSELGQSIYPTSSDSTEDGTFKAGACYYPASLKISTKVDELDSENRTNVAPSPLPDVSGSEGSASMVSLFGSFNLGESNDCISSSPEFVSSNRKRANTNVPRPTPRSWLSNSDAFKHHQAFLAMKEKKELPPVPRLDNLSFSSPTQSQSVTNSPSLPEHSGESSSKFERSASMSIPTRKVFTYVGSNNSLSLSSTKRDTPKSKKETNNQLRRATISYPEKTKSTPYLPSRSSCLRDQALSPQILRQIEQNRFSEPEKKQLKKLNSVPTPRKNSDNTHSALTSDRLVYNINIEKGITLKGPYCLELAREAIYKKTYFDSKQRDEHTIQCNDEGIFSFVNSVAEPLNGIYTVVLMQSVYQNANTNEIDSHPAINFKHYMDKIARGELDNTDEQLKNKLSALFRIIAVPISQAHIHHSALAGGLPVYFSGRVHFYHGKYVSDSNNTGHYLTKQIETELFHRYMLSITGKRCVVFEDHSLSDSKKKPREYLKYFLVSLVDGRYELKPLVLESNQFYEAFSKSVFEYDSDKTTTAVGQSSLQYDEAFDQKSTASDQDAQSMWGGVPINGYESYQCGSSELGEEKKLQGYESTLPVNGAPKLLNEFSVVSVPRQCYGKDIIHTIYREFTSFSPQCSGLSNVGRSTRGVGFLKDKVILTKNKKKTSSEKVYDLSLQPDELGPESVRYKRTLSAIIDKFALDIVNDMQQLVLDYHVMKMCGFHHEYIKNMMLIYADNMYVRWCFTERWKGNYFNFKFTVKITYEESQEVIINIVFDKKTYSEKMFLAIHPILKSTFSDNLLANGLYNQEVKAVLEALLKKTFESNISVARENCQDVLTIAIPLKKEKLMSMVQQNVAQWPQKVNQALTKAQANKSIRPCLKEGNASNYLHLMGMRAKENKPTKNIAVDHHTLRHSVPRRSF